NRRRGARRAREAPALCAAAAPPHHRSRLAAHLAAQGRFRCPRADRHGSAWIGWEGEASAGAGGPPLRSCRQLIRPLEPGRLIPRPRLRDLVRQQEPKRGIQLPAWLERLLSAGIVSKDPQTIRRQRCVNLAAIATVATTFTHLIINSIHDFRGLLPVN